MADSWQTLCGITCGSGITHVLVSVRAWVHRSRRREVVVDLSPMIERTVKANLREDGILIAMTITPGFKIWLGQRQRLLLGREGLSLQGYPWQKVA
eukprot:10518296-Alexandrium_andersonii.AAC.1